MHWKKKNQNSMNIEGGFRGSGIYPLDRAAVLKRFPRRDVNENIERSWMKSLSIPLEKRRAEYYMHRPRKLSVPGERFSTNIIRRKK